MDNQKKEEKKVEEKPTAQVQVQTERGGFHPNFMKSFADEVAKMVIQRLPRRDSQPKKQPTKNKQIQNGFFLDTSAIIDARVFDVIKLGLITGNVVVPDEILLELKHIADSKDPIKKDRGRRGMEALAKIKRVKDIKVVILPALKGKDAQKEVDEKLIILTKLNKGRLITCDYNLEKKASVHGITAINMHNLAQKLKVAAIPGESLSVKIVHLGKDTTQGVGYLDDGTMIVVEHGSHLLGQTIDVKVIRVIQTQNGKILFARPQTTAII